MTGSVDYDDAAAAPNSRSVWLVVAGLAAVALVIYTQGVVAVLVLALVIVLVGLLVGFGWSIVQAARGRAVDRSGDHPPPGFKSSGGPAAQRAEAGHESPAAAR
jgi:hypothetical protein